MSRGAGGGLTPEEFEALLAMLHSDREVAGRMYEETRNRLIRLFRLWGCTDAEAQADETFNRVARKVAQGQVREPSKPFPFIAGVARNVFLEWLRKQRRIPIPGPGSEDGPPYSQPEEEPDFRLEYVRQCLKTLAAAHCRLLLRYFEDKERIRSRKILCEELGIPMNALRIRVHRLRRKVEACVEEKLLNRR